MASTLDHVDRSWRSTVLRLGDIPGGLQTVFGNLPRSLLAVVLAAVVIVMGINTVWRAAYADLRKTDFTCYTVAGRAVIDGADIYNVRNERDWFYNYAPIFAVAMVPFALMSVFWATLTWYVISIAMLFHGAWVSARLAKRFFPKSPLQPIPMCIGAVLLLWWPIGGGVGRGQVSVLLMYLLTMSVWFYYERRHWLAGFCLATATVIKLFPALLIVYFLLKWRRTMLASTLLWSVMLLWVLPSCVFGVRGNQALIDHWMNVVLGPAVTGSTKSDPRYDDNFDPRLPRNQSVGSVAVRWIAGRSKEIAVASREPLARAVGASVAVALLLTSAWACRRGSAQPQSLRTMLELSTCFLLMLLVSPTSWNHYYSVLVLPLSFALAAAGSAAGRGQAAFFRWSLLIFAVASVLAPISAVCNQLGALMWGALALWGAFVWMLLPSPQMSAETPPIDARVSRGSLVAVKG